MKISTKVRYGTRAMLELASHYGEGPIELKEIARREDISIKYLEQVIIPLRTTGLVKAVRGSKGGYSLAKPPSEILLNDLVKTLEGPLDLIECLRNPAVCGRVQTCVTRDIWMEIQEAIHKIFNSVSLQDMLNRRSEKKDLVSPMYQI
jgi:Rrf2 family cysteine metabolism transcriptional repressor